MISIDPGCLRFPCPDAKNPEMQTNELGKKIRS
jgi:hypothetical protein